MTIRVLIRNEDEGARALVVTVVDGEGKDGVATKVLGGKAQEFWVWGQQSLRVEEFVITESS